MKKILHLFSDPSHSALWSRYLRMITMIVLFAFGSHGVWGKTQSVSLENMTPSEKGGKCTWTSNSRTLEWSAKTDNLVKIPGLEGDFSSYYNGNIIFSYSGLSDNAKFRVIITKKVGNDETTYEYHFLSTTDGKAKDVVIPIKDFTKQWGSTKITANDLTNVSRIAVAGYDTESGSVSFGTTFTITTSSSAMAMSMKGFNHTINNSAKWDKSNLKLSWTESINNYLNLWDFTNNPQDLSKFAGGSFIYTAAEVSGSDKKHRLIIRCYNEGSEKNEKDFTYATENVSNVYQTISLNDFKNGNQSISASDLQKVMKIMILGNSKTGALTLGETFTLVAAEKKYQSGIIDAKVGDRNYQIYVPEGITNTTNLKLLFTLHGRGNSYTFTGGGVPNFKDQADADKDVIIVSPQGTDQVWNAYTDKSNQTQINEYNKDFQFLKSIILALTKTGAENPTYNGNGQVTIDRTKVFTVGFSNGGMMSYALVTNHPDVFAAGGSVSGLPVNQFALHKSNGHPVPFIHFQGKNDGYVKYEQSAQHIKNWVAYNGCGNATTTTGTYDQATAADYYVEYTNGKVPFKFYGINGAGHDPNMTYSGNSSSKLIWDFIKDRTLGGTAVDMTVVWCPELSVLNGKLSNAWGATADNYIVTNNETASGNQGVNDRICFEKGKHQLRFTANGTVKIKIYKKGASDVMLYKQNNTNGSEVGFDFDITEAGDYVVEINRADGVSFSAFGIYKLDLPIESTILDNSNIPTIANGVATYSSVINNQSTVKYMNVDMTNYNSMDVSCSSITGEFHLHYPSSQSTPLNNGITTISNNLQSGEITLQSHGGSSIGIDYLRLGYNNSLSGIVDVNDNDFAVYDLTKITSETKGGKVTVSYDNSEAKFTISDSYDNLVDLDKGRNGALGSGIRFHYKGSKFRVIVTTVDGKDYTCFIPAYQTNEGYWATRHLSWKDDFKLNIEQISKIQRIRIGGTNEPDANSEKFQIKYIWFDDVDDYNRTFVCYGYENGLAGDQNTYTYTLGSAKATFSNFGWGNFKGGNMCLQIPASGTVTISNTESHTTYTGIKLFFDQNSTYDLTCWNDTKAGTGGSVEFKTNAQSLTITNKSSSPIFLSKIEFTTSYQVLEKCTLNVDGTNRNYWLYVPSSAANKKDVPVIFSLHGKQANDADPRNTTNAPKFQSVADSKGVIVVYPEGQKINNSNDYGWDATGEENADTKFIQALVKEIQTKYASQNSSNGNISVDPKRFYLCGFCMGGMMTYACAKVLNGTFAAYGSCGGYPLNEFHLNLATKQPVPFMHLHGDADGIVGINHLHTIIENLLFRNGCSLEGFKTTDTWTTASYNGTDYKYKRYDFTGVNNVPVTTVTFNTLDHTVHASAPQYLWDFFSPKTLDTYKPTTMKWQWDMTTINSNLSASDGYPYGWKRVTNENPTYLTYGDNRNTGNTGNHNVYNSIQLEKGTYKLHAKANVLQSDNTGITVGIYKVGANENSGTCIIRRKVVNNSGAASNNLSILYPFAITEDGEYYVKVERGNNQNTCTDLAIHTSDYAPDDEDDSENAMTLNTGWEKDGLIVKIDFEGVGENCKNIDEETTYIKEGKDQNKNDYIHFTGIVPAEGYKLYNRHEADNKQNWTKQDVILHDAVFGNYFQNIPKAQFYDRSGNMNYMRAVLKQGALSPIKTSGEATIGFWVNGRVAVDAGLSYNDASMLYLSGPWRKSTSVNGEVADRLEYQSMFNIRCNGNSNGFRKDKDNNQIRYYANNMFGDLCDNETTERYYKKNLYLDRNWHYVTMVMYNGLRNVDMYVDGELTNSRQNIVGGDQDLTAGLDSINHIIIGGLNATYTTFGYDPAFAFDDIVIYSRALSSQEINQIITDKEYSPNSWDFEKNIANTALLNEEKLNAGGLWTYNESEKVYTLNKQLSTEAELTYDGNRVIPAFRGLKFKTGATGQIQIDMANKRLKVTGINNAGNNATATVMTISNAPAGQYLRYEYDDIQNVWLSGLDNQTLTFRGDFTISNSKTVISEVKSGEKRQTCTCNVNGTISFKSIGSTDKVYADLCFGTSTGETNITRVSKVDFSSINEDVTQYHNYPQLLLIENGTNYGNKINFQDLTTDKYSDKIKFWSSAPHVAYIEKVENNQPTVKATGVPGSAYIYAELENNNKYDCNNDNAGLYESSSRIIARYEIHVPNKEQNYSVKISNENKPEGTLFSVGEVLSTKDQNKAVTLTLGGWNYNNHTYFINYTDGYTEKKEWNGMPLKKTTNGADGYSSVYDKDGPTTDGDTYTDLSYYTGGTHAASSEQMDGNEDKGLFSTTVENNSTAWTLPCRGSYAKVEPTEAGIISVYVLQEGCMERNLTGETHKYFENTIYEKTIAANEPYDISIKKVYVADEAGQVIEDVVTDTKSKIVSQVWKDDGRARAEYSYYVKNTAYSELLHDRFDKNILKPELDAVRLLDQWNSPGMTQNIIKFGKGFGIVDKGIVRYTFNVLPGKTYYVFSNDAKMGIAGFNFTKDKQLNFNSEHEIIADNPLAGDLTRTESVTLNDGEKYSEHTEKNAEVKLNRTFYKNYWNAICLPYSINRRQIEKVFGDGTMVVLMNYIDTSNKKVMFIEHANQDIIAGYPYLIFPTDKADNNKEKHDPITGITTRATFGEANSPLFSVGTDGKTYPFAEPMQSDALVFKGTFTNNTPLTEGSYVVTNKGVLSRIPNDEMKIKPYRSYIYFNRETAGAKAIKLASMGFAGIDDMEGETTSIEDLLFNDGIMTRPADVFNVNGQKVRSKAENLYGLPKGVYIVNGKKYVNK